MKPALFTHANRGRHSVTNGRKLPRSVQEIADVIGRDNALLLIGQLPRAYSVGHPAGEVILYVPKTLRFDHPLIAMIGYPAALKLVRVFGGEILKPATCAHIYRDFRDAAIRNLARQGATNASLAEWFNLTERRVREIAREDRDERMKEPCAA